jgi:predicted transcriptional regulator YdeE
MKKTPQVSCDHQRAWVRSWAAHALFLLAAFTVSGAHAQLFSLEEPRYQSLQKDAAFELRLYNPMIVAEVVVQGDLAAAGKEGSRLVKQYIFREGPNAALDSKAQAADRISMTVPVTMEKVSEKIAMTVPVTMEATTNSTYRLHFVMPSAYTLDTLPKSADPRVSIRAIPEQKWASVRFSTFSTEANIAEQTALLKNWMNQQGLRANGPPQFARYDPPSVPPLLRRSEILIPVQ